MLTPAPNLNCGGGGCPEGEECLPNDYIDPADCPAGMISNPTDIPNIAQWYDASDDASFTFTTGDQVDTWADKSGNAHDLTAYQFDADRPTRFIGLNGQSVVADTGSNMTTGAYARTGPVTIFAVASWNNQFGDGAAEAAVAAADISGIFWRDSGGSLVAIGSGGGAGGGDVAFNAPHLVTIVLNDASSLSRLDRLDVGAGDWGIWDQTAFFIFGDSGANRALRGYIAELIVYDRALDTTETAQVEDYLLRRWFNATEGVVASYVPYAYNAVSVNPADVDATILAMSPWGYWKMDDASGAPQDSSGNGRHAAISAGSVTYQEPALTAKSTASIKLNTHTTCITFPPLVSMMSIYTQPFTLMGVTSFDDDGTPTSNGVVFMSEVQNSGASMFGFYLQPNSDLWLFINQAPVSSMDSFKPGIGVPFVWAIVANAFSVTVYINGVVASTGFRLNASYTENTWAFGVTGFFTNPTMHISNIVAWDSALSQDDVVRLSQALMDADICANATVIS
jgi:hypothetical protein